MVYKVMNIFVKISPLSTTTRLRRKVRGDGRAFGVVYGPLEAEETKRSQLEEEDKRNPSFRESFKQ